MCCETSHYKNNDHSVDGRNPKQPAGMYTLQGTLTYPTVHRKLGKSSTQKCPFLGKGYVLVPWDVPNPANSGIDWIDYQKKLELDSFCYSVFHPSKVVSTHLWNTPLNLYQRFIVGVAWVLPKGCACSRCVARNFLGIHDVQQVLSVSFKKHLGQSS